MKFRSDNNALYVVLIIFLWVKPILAMTASEQAFLFVTDSPLDMALQQEMFNADENNREIIRHFLEQGFRPSNATYNLLLSSWASHAEKETSFFKDSPFHILIENDRQNPKHENVSSINYAFIWALRNNEVGIAAFVFDRGLDFQALFPSIDDMEMSVDIVGLLSSLELTKMESIHTAYTEGFIFGYHEVLQAFLEFLKNATLEQIDWAFNKSNEITEALANQLGLNKNNMRSRCGHLFQQKFQEITFRNIGLFPALHTLFAVFDKKINIATHAPELLEKVCEKGFAYRVSEALQSLSSFDAFHRYTNCLNTIHGRRVNNDVKSLIQTKQEELWRESVASYDPVTFPSIASFRSRILSNLGKMAMSDEAIKILWKNIFIERVALVEHLDQMVEVAQSLALQEAQQDSDYEPNKLFYLRNRVFQLFSRELSNSRFSTLAHAMDVLNSYKNLNIFFKEQTRETEKKVIAEFAKHLGKNFQNEIYAAKSEQDLVNLQQICQKIHSKYSQDLEDCEKAIRMQGMKVIFDELMPWPWSSYQKFQTKVSEWQRKGILVDGYNFSKSSSRKTQSITLDKVWLEELDVLFEKNTEPEQFLEVIKWLNACDPERIKEIKKRIHDVNVNLFVKKIDNHHYADLTSALQAYFRYYNNNLIFNDEAFMQAIIDKFIERAVDYESFLAIVRALIEYNFHEAAIKIKKRIWSDGLIKHAQQYVDLLGQVIVGIFMKDVCHLEGNSELVFETFKPFVDSRQNIQELFSLQIFIANVPLHKKFQQQREELQIYVDIALVTQREKDRRKASKKLFDDVKKLYEEALSNPELLNGPCQFYMLRSRESDNQESAPNIGHCQCEEEINDEQPAIFCVHHEQPMGFHLKKSEHTCHCLATVMELQRGQLITCLGQPAHELPITDADLHAEGFRDEEILRVRHETLLAYYQALAGEHAEQYKWCVNEYCHYPIWTKNVDKEGSYVCPSCGENYCFSCGERPHPNLSCRAIKDFGWLNNPASELRPCPWCSHAFIKDERCNIVTCDHCNRGFHFVRGKMRELSVNRHDIDFRPRTYLVPGEKGYQPGKESAEPPSLGNFIAKF